jgi:hypothetical protein
MGLCIERHFRPDAPLQQAIVVAIELFTDGDALRVEVLQGGPVALLLLDIADMHLVDETMLALGRHLRLRRVRLVGFDVVVLQAGQHRFHARVHFRLIVAGAKPGQQELQDEGRDVGAFLDSMQQILAQHLAVELFQQLDVQIILGHTV